MLRRWYKWRGWFRRSPREIGWYLCTVENRVGELEVMRLWYDTIDGGQWMDKTRLDMFEGYKCYLSGRAAIEENRVIVDMACYWNSRVIAWRKMPGVYRGNLFTLCQRLGGRLFKRLMGLIRKHE